MKKKKVIIVAGPTGSGKTEIALALAEKFNGELINSDSRQVYKYLNIGTNKGNISSKDNHTYIKSIPIHLINILEPNEQFNVFEFKKLAEKKIDEIITNKKLPIVVGGTGLYIDSLVRNYIQTDIESDPDLRNELNNLTLEELRERIKKEDYESLNDSDKQNPRRLIRIIEKESSNQYGELSESIYDYLILYPKYVWEELKEKLDKRVEHMFEYGLVNETKLVLKKGFSRTDPGLQVMGYKEVQDYLEEKITIDQCIDLVKIAHRQYAKRQRTWFEGIGRNYDLKKVDKNIDAIAAVKLFTKFVDM